MKGLASLNAIYSVVVLFIKILSLISAHLFPLDHVCFSATRSNILQIYLSIEKKITN